MEDFLHKNALPFCPNTPLIGASPIAKEMNFGKATIWVAMALAAIYGCMGEKRVAVLRHYRLIGTSPTAKDINFGKATLSVAMALAAIYACMGEKRIAILLHYPVNRDKPYC